MASRQRISKQNLDSASTAIDLFSGCGGLTLGLKRAHFKVVAAVEKDPVAIETYRVNHPEVCVWETDIQDLAAANIRRGLKLRPGQLDLLAACPPCQAFSSIRTRNGAQIVRDPTKNLVFEILRFARALRPKSVMLENVPRLAKDKRFAAVCAALRRMGYACEFRIVNAADHGVPQRRRRLILVANRLGRVAFAKPSASQKTVRQAFKGLRAPRSSADSLHKVTETRSLAVKERIRHIPADGGSRSDAGYRFRLKCHRQFDGFKDVYGRMSWDDVSPTITSGCVNPSKGRFLHPDRNRTITLREAAILQGFPRRYFISQAAGKFRAAALIGNAIPPELVRRQANTINGLIHNPDGSAARPGPARQHAKH
jgi:DNA (cytosine-5)-methyltransferase 1